VDLTARGVVDLIINGERRALPGPVSVADLVHELLAKELTDQVRGVAVAVNGEVVPRSVWAATALNAGDSIEVLTAVQGG
jgi:sulfur carrier protein